MVNFKLTQRQLDILTVLARREGGITEQSCRAFGWDAEELRKLAKRNMVRVVRGRQGSTFVITDGGRDQLPLK